VGGLVLHTIGIVLMLYHVMQPPWGKLSKRAPGVWHLMLLAYVCFLLAVVVVLLIGAGTSAGDEVAGSGGLILILGWYSLGPDCPPAEGTLER
jgi:hypothetical protein